MGSEAASSNRLTQADRSALSERRTLEAAVALMGERGYEKTTLAAIGEAAGYSRGLATHLFGSKPDLFAQVIRWIGEKLRREVEPALRDRGGVDALIAFGDAHRRFGDKNPVMTRALYVLWFQSLIADSPTRPSRTCSVTGIGSEGSWSRASPRARCAPMSTPTRRRSSSAARSSAWASSG